MYTILHVEDTPDVWVSLVRILSKTYRVLTAPDADKALAILKVNQGTEQQVDLILLDINLPVGKTIPDSNWGHTTGVQFARYVLKELRYNIPIVCFTGEAQTQLKREMSEIGVKDIIVKGKEIAEIKRVLLKYLPEK